MANPRCVVADADSSCDGVVNDDGFGLICSRGKC